MAWEFYVSRGDEQLRVTFAKEPKSARQGKSRRDTLRSIMEAGGARSVKMWAAARSGVMVEEV